MVSEGLEGLEGLEEFKGLIACGVPASFLAVRVQMCEEFEMVERFEMFSCAELAALG